MQANAEVKATNAVEKAALREVLEEHGYCEVCGRRVSWSHWFQVGLVCTGTVTGGCVHGEDAPAESWMGKES